MVYPYVLVCPLLNSKRMSIFHFMPTLTNRLTGAFSLGRYTVYLYVFVRPLLNSERSSIFHFTAVDDNSQLNLVGTTDKADTHKCERTSNTLRK